MPAAPRAAQPRAPAGAPPAAAAPRAAPRARAAAPPAHPAAAAPRLARRARADAPRRAAAAAAASSSTSPTLDSPAMEVVDVALGERAYPIYIGRGLLDDPALLRAHVPGATALIVTNETVAPLYLERCAAALAAPDPASGRSITVHSVILPDGEQHKSLDVLARVWDAALAARLDRNTTFVALGGGVVGDMAGFAAAAYQRGVHFVQVPTTVMAQVDSSVGGKTGVNHPAGKNMIGAFYQPRAVLVDTDTLATLPDRELASGISEIVKYGLIRDAPLFEWLEGGGVEALLAREPGALAHAIRRSCENKAAVVAADEREGGVRATLNLGHTFGHAVETASGYGTWLHGEAVSAGTVMAADLSRRLGWIDAPLQKRIVALLRRAQLPVAPPAAMTRAAFREIMAVDKKVLDGRLRLVLLKGPLGGCVVTGDFEAAALAETLAAFCAKDA
jgi:3-dehydroquinate synthase